jgi:hypothetical protein
MPRNKKEPSAKLITSPNSFWFNETKSIITVKEKNESRFSQALKLHLTKKNIVHPLLSAAKHVCVFCGTINTTWFFKTKIEGKNIIIESIDFKKPIDYCFSKNKNCYGKQLNPNSIEFVSKTRRLSEEDAMRFIHARNKSPFYAENHSSHEQYKNYQATRVFGKSENEIKHILEKQNWSRSLTGYIARFGEEGKNKWELVQKSKAVTIENLHKKHGEDAIAHIDRWKSKVGPSLENFRARHGKEEGLIRYRKFHENANRNKTNAYGCVTVEDGHTLRSNLERKFFNALKNANIPNDSFMTDGCYPESIMRYDFYFPKINLYVEIAGMLSEEYENKLQKKIEKFNPIVLRPSDLNYKNLNDIINHIVDLLGH